MKNINAANASKAVVIVGNSQANTITACKGNDIVNGGAGNDVIEGGGGADKLFGEAGNDKLSGGEGNDTLTGGAGNDTLTGGGGADVFIYEGGNDVITDFSASRKDSIKLTSGSETGATLKGSDMTFKIGSGALTVKGGKDQEITLGSAIYYNNLVYDAKKAGMTLGSGFSGTLKATDYATTVKTIDASVLTKGVGLVGNKQANTLTGGAGNDTLTGGEGKDVFEYTAGKDVITDYSASDTIRLSSGTVTSYSYSGTDVVFKIGNGSLTVKNGVGQKITITDGNKKTSSERYSNGNAAVTGTSALMVDENFIGGATLDEISEAKIAVTSVQTDADTLAPDTQTFLTYSDK